MIKKLIFIILIFIIFFMSIISPVFATSDNIIANNSTQILERIVSDDFYEQYEFRVNQFILAQTTYILRNGFSNWIATNYYADFMYLYRYNSYLNSCYYDTVGASNDSGWRYRIYYQDTTSQGYSTLANGSVIYGVNITFNKISSVSRWQGTYSESAVDRYNGASSNTLSFRSPSNTYSIYDTGFFDNNSYYIVKPQCLVDFGLWVEQQKNILSSSGGSGGASIDYTRLQEIIENALQSSGADNETISAISNSVDDIKDTATATQQTAEQIEDFLKDNQVDNGSYDQSSTNVPHASSSDLNGAFNQLKNVFIGGQALDIVLPIPFTEEDITIPSTLTKDMLGTKGKFISDIVSLIFNYILAVWIVKDVNKYITKLKDGSIVDGSDTDIKADML